jgi:hypothetical protein
LKHNCAAQITTKEFFLFLPRVSSTTRETIARELDSRGPAACVQEAVQELSATNPEILDMATKCAASFGQHSERALLELCMFYRLLSVELKRMTAVMALLCPLPRVSEQTRARVLEQIDGQGVERFTISAINELEASNAELLQMAHNAATRLGSYLLLMQGFALLYKALSEQAMADSAGISLH